MNHTSSSSFVGFIDSTSTGGNLMYAVKEYSLLVCEKVDAYFDTVKEKTQEAINESLATKSMRFNTVKELFDSLEE